LEKNLGMKKREERRENENDIIDYMDEKNKI
jgi:hypothetical protein